MSVYDFLSMVNDLSWSRVFLFDLLSDQGVVYDSDECEDDILTDVDIKGFGDYEVESVDIYTDDDKRINIELNISVDKDE